MCDEELETLTTSSVSAISGESSSDLSTVNVVFVIDVSGSIGSELERVNVISHDRAAISITVIDNALDKVLTKRARIGASENALEHNMSSLVVAHENLTAAESSIRDANIARVMMLLTKLNIMRQANMSMLAQANQLPQNVLSLVR